MQGPQEEEEGGAQGDGNGGLAGGADDFVGGTDDGMRDEERWGELAFNEGFSFLTSLHSNRQIAQ